MAKILRRERLVPNIHLIEVFAPEIAKKAKPGQFVIIMPDEKGERIPLSIADWDTKTGSITSIVLIVGTSTQKLSLLQEGDEVPVFVGPLGKPSKIEKYGTVLCAGGCFGIGAIYPVARALKEAGNKVISLLDVKANYLLYWEDKMKQVSDYFIVSARDSYFNCKDYISDKIKALIKEKNRPRSLYWLYLFNVCRVRGNQTLFT